MYNIPMERPMSQHSNNVLCLIVNKLLIAPIDHRNQVAIFKFSILINGPDQFCNIKVTLKCKSLVTKVL